MECERQIGQKFVSSINPQTSTNNKNSNNASKKNGPTQIHNKTNKINPFNDAPCCIHLDEFCQDVELQPDRKIRICLIPGWKTLSQADPHCYKNNEKIKNKNDLLIGSSNGTFKSKIVTKDLAIERNSKELNHFADMPKNIIEETAIYMIHGVGGELKVWSPQIIFLNSFGFTVLAVDLIGHGGSSAPFDKEMYMFDKMSNDVLTIFDQFKMSRNIIMGHSYGCCFAALIARQRSNYVHSLIMISGGGPIPLGPQLGVFCLPLCCLDCFKWLLYREFLRRSYHKPDQGNACQLAAVNTPIHVLKNTLNGQKWDDGDAKFYSLIISPTLLIHGREDRLISVDEVRFMKNTLRSSTLEMLKDVGHMVMLESPTEVNNIIANFIEANLNKHNSATSLV